VLKCPSMFRDAEEWSEDHFGAQESLANKRAWRAGFLRCHQRSGQAQCEFPPHCDYCE
jgi:hypothetical protein